jgi:hypothetical protein
MNNLQKIGGIAALSHAGAYIVGIILAVTLIAPVLDADAGEYLAFVADNQVLMHTWILVCYWLASIALVVLALALYERLKASSPVLTQTATVFGLIWAGLIIGSGNLMLHDFGVVTDLYAQDPAQATTVWLAFQAVETGIVSGNELVGSLWVLLISLAALRTGELRRALNYLGVVLGVAGILTLIPTSIGTMIFGLGMIVWSIGLGIIMFRSNPSAAAPKIGAFTLQPINRR